MKDERTIADDVLEMARIAKEDFEKLGLVDITHDSCRVLLKQWVDRCFKSENDCKFLNRQIFSLLEKNKELQEKVDELERANK